ncbi:MAG: flavodoxin family protein [Moorellaceae bacterium]
MWLTRRGTDTYDMKVLGIAGSPRRRGNSELLLDAALAGAAEYAAETHKIILAELRINPCRGCESCRSGECVQRDDMDRLYPWLEQAEVIILASPVYFYGLTAQAKAMIDRCQVFWNRSRQNPVKEDKWGRRGALIAVGATRGPQLFAGAVLTTKYFFKALGMTYCQELLLPGLEERGAVLQYKETLEAARKLGREVVLNHCRF